MTLLLIRILYHLWRNKLSYKTTRRSVRDGRDVINQMFSAGSVYCYNMQIWRILFGLFVALKIHDIHGQTCDEITYTTINDIRRSTKFKQTTTTTLCDRNFIQDDKWYRFDSVAGDTIPTHNPGNTFCGTYIPIWFKGTHPTQDNVVVDAKACLAVPFIPPAGCGKSHDIKVIKCENFYLYRLKEPKLCDSAYCAGKSWISL